MTLVNVENRAGVAILTLDDPGRRNALSLDLNAELIDAVAAAERDPEISAIVVTGAPPAFCAGADLSQLGESRRDGLEAIYAGFLAVADTPLPTIAAVNGAAVGAGMNLALACDLRLAGASARFDTRFLSLGIHPGGGHTWMMNGIVGSQATMATVLFGEILDATQAERVGLVWQAVPDDDLLDVAIELASRAGRGGRELAIRAKNSIRDASQALNHPSAVASELEVQLWSMDQPAFAERLAAMKARISSSDKSSR